MKIGLTFLSLFILGGFLILWGQEEQPKKIAIASDGEAIDSQVGSQGARCSWFLFFDQQGELTEALENPYQQADREAGVKCTELLADHGVTIFVAGNIGDRMAEALEGKNIDFIAFSGTVKEAIKHVLEENPTQGISSCLEEIPNPQLHTGTVSLFSELPSTFTGQNGSF